MTTTLPTPEAAPAEKKRSVNEMMDTEGFNAWLETVPAAKNLEMSDENRDRIEALFKAFEAGKTVSEDIRNICNEKLLGDDETGIISPITDVEFEKLEKGLCSKGLRQPEYLLKLRKDIEDFRKLPQDIHAREEKLAELEKKTTGLAELDQKLKDAKQKKETIEKAFEKDATATAPKWPRTSFLEVVKFNLYTKRSEADFKAEMEALEKKGDAKSLAKKAEKEKFQKILTDEEAFRTERTDLEKALKLPFGKWDSELAKLEAEIKALEPKFTEAKDAKAAFDAATAEAKGMRERVQKMREDIFASVPNYAEIHTRASEEVHKQLAEALQSKDLDVIDATVERFSKFEMLAKTRGVRSNYLDDFLPAGVSLDEYKNDLNKAVKDMVTTMLVDILKQMPSGELYTAFKADVDVLITRVDKKLGFDSPAKSREFVVNLLEAQKTEAEKQLGTGKATNIKRLIYELKHPPKRT